MPTTSRRPPAAATRWKAAETLFQQDLNGDGTIGVTSRLIDSNGTTSLFQVADRFAFDSVDGPQVKFGGAAVTVGEFGDWTPVAAAQTANGYELAWKDAVTNQYSVWSTDRSGDMLANDLTPVSGDSTALQSAETLFHQDLNGDGTVGIPTSSSSSGGLQLAESGVLVSYAASTFASAGVDNSGSVVQINAADQTDLTKPHA